MSCLVHIGKSTLRTALAAAKFVITDVNGNPCDPRGKRMILPTAKVAEREIGFRKTLLNKLLDFATVTEKPAHGSGYCPSIPFKDLGKRLLIAGQNRTHEIFIRCVRLVR